MLGLPWRSSGWHSALPMQGARVRSLVGELGSHMLHGAAKKKKKKLEKELIQINSKKKKILIKNWAENLNRHFSKEDLPIANRYMKECSASLIIREMQLEITMRYQHTQVRMAIIKKIYKIGRAHV